MSIVVSKVAEPYAEALLDLATSNDTLKEAYINEVSKICDLDFSKLIQGESKSKKVSPAKKEEVKESTNTVWS